MNQKRHVLLLKHGQFSIVECPHADVFVLARVRDAGICGVYKERGVAEQKVEELNQAAKEPRPVSTWFQAR